MSKTVQISHEYQADPDRLWSIATDWDCLRESMKGVATFYGLPDQPIAAGQKIEVDVSIFGILPRAPWTMEIVCHDSENRILKSHEYGGAVRRWDHTLQIVETERGSRLTDTIEIDAGSLTFVYCRWAGFMYRRRHEPRQRLLRAR